MSEIELRLSSVDPPDPEPKRTIYRDIVNLPDPVKLGLTIRYFNYDNVDLYFQITGSGTGYTFGTVNLGLLASGANAYINLDQFASRAKPSTSDLPNGEMEENITLILKGYTDSGYTNLKWTFERVVTVHWINSADAAFTVDFLNNFDDGTVQGWNFANEQGSTGIADYIGTITAATDYVLSTPYSCKVKEGGDCSYSRRRLYKSFTTPNKDKVFMIADLRFGIELGASPGTPYAKYEKVRFAGADLVFLGQPADAVALGYCPINKWIRIICLLPKNTTGEVQFVFQHYSTCYRTYGVIWLDDFKIISK